MHENSEKGYEKCLFLGRNDEKTMRNTVFHFISHSSILLINRQLNINHENMRNEKEKSGLERLNILLELRANLPIFLQYQRSRILCVQIKYSSIQLPTYFIPSGSGIPLHILKISIPIRKTFVWNITTNAGIHFRIYIHKASIIHIIFIDNNL